MELGEVIAVLSECQEFVGFFGSDRSDVLLLRIHAAQDYLKMVCRTGIGINLTYVMPPPVGPARIENIVEWEVAP